MKLLNYSLGGKVRLGIKTDKGILDVEKSREAFPDIGKIVPSTMEAVLESEGKGVPALEMLVQRALMAVRASGDSRAGLFLEEETLQFEPCVRRPGKVIGCGLNYYELLRAYEIETPVFPYLFNKFGTSTSAHNGTVLIPYNSDQVDYEAEIAIVIGKKTRRVSEEEALDHVFGYCNTNDLSARDLQYSTLAWMPGKACDGFCPLGPYLVTADEVGDPNDALPIRAYLNGELRQENNTSDMIYKCKGLVSRISSYFTLHPGDVILTGTPSGIVHTYPEEERVYLQDGDIVDIEVGNLGRLRSYFKKETI